MSVEPEAAGRCGERLVAYDHDEAISELTSCSIFSLAHHRWKLSLGGRTAVGVAADRAVFDVLDSPCSRRVNGELPHSLAALRPPLS